MQSNNSIQKKNFISKTHYTHAFTTKLLEPTKISIEGVVSQNISIWDLFDVKKKQQPKKQQNKVKILEGGKKDIF